MKKRIPSLLFAALALALQPAAALASEEPAPPRETIAEKPAPAEGGVFADDVRIIVDGETVDAAPAGREATLRVRFHNASQDTLAGARVELDGEGVRFIDASAKLGDLAPDATAEASFSLVALEDGCQDFVGLLGRVTYDGGETDTKLGLSVVCPGPRLYVSGYTFSGGDGDDVPEPGERLRLNVTLHNAGIDPATDVRASLSVILGDGIRLVDDAGTWPTIAPGESATSEDGFAVEIAESADVEQGCEQMPGNDAVVSSDDSAVHGVDGSGDGDGAVEPGTATLIEPEAYADGDAVVGTTTTVDPDEEKPVVEEPVAEEPVEEPESHDTPVRMELKLAGTASSTTWETTLGTGIVCALYDGTHEAVPATGGGDDTKRAELAAEGTPVGSTSRAPLASLATLLALATAAMVVRSVLRASRA